MTTIKVVSICGNKRVLYAAKILVTQFDMEYKNRANLLCQMVKYEFNDL